MGHKKVLLIGWDAADWKVIRPLLNRGEMPYLQSLINRGCHGNLATMEPPLSPMLWTSIATGKRPLEHGVHGFTEPSPNRKTVQPISNRSRKVKAIWNILNQEGWRPSVVGWWPSHPVEPLNGVMVSDFFRKVPDDPEVSIPAPLKGSIHPPEWRNRLAECRVRPTELNLAVLQFFCPDADKVDQAQDKSLHSLAKIVCDTITTHNVALEVLEDGNWDFLAVYHDSIDHFSHRFMAYHPPRLPWIDEKTFGLYSPIVANAYRYHDAMLGQMLKFTDEETTVMVISDHGFRSDHQRLPATPAEPAGPANDHRPYGIFVACGPGIKRGETVFGATLLNICPTLLHLCGLPVGEDMPARPLLSIFSESRDVTTIPSWEERKGNGNDARLTGASSFASTPALDPEMLQQLIDLGYISPSAAEGTQAVSECLKEQEYNLARNLFDSGCLQEARDLMEPLWERFPDEHRFGILLIHLLRDLRDPAQRRQALETLRKRVEQYQESAREELEKIVAGEKNKEKPSAEEAQSPQERQKQFKRRRLASLARGLPVTLDWLETTQALFEGDHTRARSFIDKLKKEASHHRSIPWLLPQAYGELEDWEEVVYWADRCLVVNPDHHSALRIKAIAWFRLRNWEEALRAAVDSLALIYFQPNLHNLLGSCLWRLGRLEDAAVEYEVAIQQAPAYLLPYRLLSQLYRGPLNSPEKAVQYQVQAETLREMKRSQQKKEEISHSPETSGTSVKEAGKTESAKSDPIIIVSGLPRSGTSLMMQILLAGGLSLCEDHARPADENNPRGFAEDSRVMQLTRISNWVPEARGKALKVIAPLLACLPEGERYFVIVMKRPEHEIAASQKTMLSRLGKSSTIDSQAAPEALTRLLQRSLTAVKQRSGFRFLEIDYPKLIQSPEAELAKLKDFLPLTFSPDQAARAIDPSLYREKSPPA